MKSEEFYSSIIEDMYQVNLTITVDGGQSYWVSRYSDYSYRGITVDCEYSDGVDSTDWCIFTGTKEECLDFARHPKRRR
jgi:hypothetical protein